ncbi:15243_t:CDS:2, partial [Racocetra persica]
MLLKSALEGHLQCIIAIGKTGNEKASQELFLVYKFIILEMKFLRQYPGFDDSNENSYDETARLIFRALLDK